MSRTTVAAFPRDLSGNPYCALLYRHLEEAGIDVIAGDELSPAWIVRHRADVGVLHLHWPEMHYRGPGGAVTARSAAAFVASILLARRLGYRIVWTAHNALPHEPHPADVRLRALLMRVARVVVHGDAARATLPSSRWPVTVVPHGHYIGWYPDTVGEDEARRRLGLRPTDHVTLFFGQLRAYKGLDDLLQAFSAHRDPRRRLVIAGRPVTSRDATEAHAAAERDERIQVHDRHIPDDEVQVFFRAADFVALPYRRVLTSGAAMLALSFGRPVVAPHTGCLAELSARGCAITYSPAGRTALANALDRAAATDARPWRRRARTAAETMHWDAIATAYARVYGLPVRGAAPRLSA